MLELALLQEECCEKLLSLGEADSIRLVLPALCLTEPLDTLVRRAKDRKALASQLEVEVKQLSRTALYQIRLDRLQEIVDLLLQSAENETLRLFQMLERILTVSEIIPMSPEIVILAADAQRNIKLSPQDSIVYASVVHHLNTANASKKCFLNRNSMDFHQLDIKTTLDSHNCKLLFSFETGYNDIQSQMR